MNKLLINVVERLVFGAVFLLLVLAAFLGTAQAIELEWTRNNSRIASQFIRIVTTTENRNSSPERVTRWRRSIDIELEGDVSRAAREIFDVHLNLLRSLGIDIALNNSGDKMDIFFIDQASFAKRAKRDWPANNPPECYGTNKTYSGGSEDGRIISSTILIPRNLSLTKTRGCIEEEVTQTLGLLNDSFELVDSLFNDENLYDRLSDSDKVFVGLLYHPKVKIGMLAPELYDVALEVLNEWHPQGNIASKSANRGGISGGNVSESKIRVWEDSLKNAIYRGNQATDRYFLDQYRLARQAEKGGIIEAQGALHLGKHYLHAGDDTNALKLFARAEGIFKGSLRSKSLKMAEVYYYLGSALMKGKRYDESQQRLLAAQRVLSDWPGHELHSKVRSTMAGNLIGLRRFTDARNLSRRLVADLKYPDGLRINALYYLGIANLGTQDFAEVRSVLALMRQESSRLNALDKKNARIAIENLASQLANATKTQR